MQIKSKLFAQQATGPDPDASKMGLKLDTWSSPARVHGGLL